jgi:hypothetical protein
MDGVVIFLVSSLAMNVGDPLLALAGDPVRERPQSG